jgi:heme oxygenase-like protein
VTTYSDSAVMTIDPLLPTAVGPISGCVLDLLGKAWTSCDEDVDVEAADPWGLDLQLALYTCYELHYRGFAGVDGLWEWDPGLLGLRGRLERVFLDAVRTGVGDVDPEVTAAEAMAELSIEPVNGTGLSYFLRDEGSWDQMCEYFVHRSLYHLKEADPHAFVIPRLSGTAKAAFVAVEYDEYGAGRGERVHQRLFADLLQAADLDATYLGYLDDVPADTLAVVNLMSLFGLHRHLRGAAVGHFAATEISSPPGSNRIVQALERMGAPQPCALFYREHVEADAVHEQVVRLDVVGDLVAREPTLDRDVVFGIRAWRVVEDRLSDHMMACWRAETSSLRRADATF